MMSEEHPWEAPLPSALAEVSNFCRLLLVKVFRPEKLVECISEFIATEMGRQYIETPPLDLSAAFDDSKSSTPLVFVMSAGADPMSNILRFATDRNYLKRMHAIS